MISWSKNITQILAKVKYDSCYHAFVINFVYFSGFMKKHTNLVKGYDFAIYVMSSITSSKMIKSLSLIQDNVTPKKYIIVSELIFIN